MPIWDPPPPRHAGAAEGRFTIGRDALGERTAGAKTRGGPRPAGTARSACAGPMSGSAAGLPAEGGLGAAGRGRSTKDLRRHTTEERRFLYTHARRRLLTGREKGTGYFFRLIRI